MSERSFLDTNLLVYADDELAGDKTRLAQEVLREVIVTRAAVLSTQVLQEYFVVATRKLHVPPDVARKKVELLASLEVVQVDVELLLAAIDLGRLHPLSFWDALVVSCARASGCTRLLTEDLGDGEVIAGVRIENPFRGLA